MRASIKLLLWLFAGISTLAAVLVALLFFIDVNLYRGQIERHVSTAFGRVIILTGPLSLEPSLTPRFAVNGLKITNPDWASRPFLALVDKFDIRVSLLPLLMGELQIISLEFHGVDLLLEEAADGANNFTFSASGQPTVLPAIGHLSLHNAAIAYAAAEGPVRRMHMEQVTARKVPGQPVELEAHTAVNAVPVTLSLHGEPPDDGQVDDAWQITLLGEAGDLSLRVEGSVADPTDWHQGAYRLALKGRHLDDLETLSGYALPESGPFKLGANIRFRLDEYLAVSDFTAHIGGSELHGKFRWDMDTPRPVIKVRLESQQLNAGDLGIADPPTGIADHTNTAYWDQPFAIGGLGTVELDVEVRVRQLEGLTKPIQNIRLDAQASGETLILAPLEATLDGTQLEARVQLPWGERLTALKKDGVNVQGLVQQADVALKAQPPHGKLRYQTTIAGQAVDLGLTGFEASAPPGEGLQVSASALLDDIPIQVTLQAEPLAHLLQRPTGPWRHLTAEVRGGDIRFQASGSVDRPFEARGFDVDYKLSGTRIDRLLPLFDLVLPLEGAYSLSGRFADLPDRFVFDELKIRAGDSDIGGRISVYQGQPRPRVVANLKSEQIYLNKLLPGSETEAAPGAEQRVIPDYNLPIERMREIDGELTFKGKRLRTAVGELGNINFTATLKDGVFRMYPFQVSGWAGALIESNGLIDASQDPPTVEWNWIARQLNYGVLLEQAGFAETVEGTIDVTLRLSGNGRTRHEFLSNADGQLIIVGQEGRFGSRRLDLWGSALITTMLSREWHSEDVTDLNCMVARIGIEDGVASSDKFIVDTQRITIAATGTLDLASEALNLVIAPRPKRTTLVSLANPVHVTGTLAAPQAAATVLPRNRMAAAGTGMLAGLINPGYLIFTFSRTASGPANACAAAVAETMAMKGTQDQTATANGYGETPRQHSVSHRTRSQWRF